MAACPYIASTDPTTNQKVDGETVHRVALGDTDTVSISLSRGLAAACLSAAPPRWTLCRAATAKMLATAVIPPVSLTTLSIAPTTCCPREMDVWHCAGTPQGAHLRPSLRPVSYEEV